MNTKKVYYRLSVNRNTPKKVFNISMILRDWVAGSIHFSVIMSREIFLWHPLIITNLWALCTKNPSPLKSFNEGVSRSLPRKHRYLYTKKARRTWISRLSEIA